MGYYLDTNGMPTVHNGPAHDMMQPECPNGK